MSHRPSHKKALMPKTDLICLRLNPFIRMWWTVLRKNPLPESRCRPTPLLSKFVTWTFVALLKASVTNNPPPGMYLYRAKTNLLWTKATQSAMQYRKSTYLLPKQTSALPVNRRNPQNAPNLCFLPSLRSQWSKKAMKNVLPRSHHR